MITRIECANCGDVVEVTSTVVILPFYCTPCQAGANEDISMEEVLGQKYEDMAPASEKTFEADDVIEQDATNALISDLEAQNTNLLNEITSLDNRIVTLRRDVKVWEREAAFWIGQYKKANARVNRVQSHPWKNLWAYMWE